MTGTAPTRHPGNADCPPQQPPARPTPGKATDSGRPDIEDSAILVVDDSEIAREIIGGCLSKAGYRNIHHAADGRQALEIIEKRPPDLVILDLEMPVLDGFEVCRRLRQTDKTRTLPVLIQSGRDTPHDISRAFEAGASDMIVKPVRKFELLARVRVHIQNRLMLTQLLNYNLRVATELQSARDTQQALCPTDGAISEISARYGLEIEARYEPSSELGGDMWGLCQESDSRLAFYICDFSGHGVAAALSTFRLQTLMARIDADTRDPAAVLACLNRSLYEMLAVGEFATMLFGRIDVDRHTLTYASAGAPPPLYFAAPSGDQIGTGPSYCQSAGVPLGLRRVSDYRDIRLPFPAGSRIFLYSDALIEAEYSNGHALGLDGLLRQAASRPTKGDKTFFGQALGRFDRNVSRPLTDDLTAFSISLNSEPPRHQPPGIPERTR